MTASTVDWRLVSSVLAASIPLIAVIWKLSGLKAETHSKWYQRVSLIEAGLDELASNKLLVLRAKIEDLLDSRGKFDPTKVVEDPANLKAPAKVFLSLIKKRRKVKLYFSVMLHVIQLLMFSCVGLMMGVITVFFHFTQLVEASWLIRGGYWVAGVSGVAAVACFVLFVTCQYLLGNAEVMVNEQLKDE